MNFRFELGGTHSALMWLVWGWPEADSKTGSFNQQLNKIVVLFPDLSKDSTDVLSGGEHAVK